MPQTKLIGKEKLMKSGGSIQYSTNVVWVQFWTQSHMWVELVGSVLCSERFFFKYSGFPETHQKL